jgi:predicted transcriptional regulator
LEISKELLEKLYLDENKTQKEIAEQLGTTQSVVSYFCQKYNIHRPKRRNHKNKYKPWTDEDIQNLRDWYGIYSFDTIAKRLGRTAKGVETQKNKLKLGNPLKYTEYITAFDLAKALNRGHSSVTMWINKRGLPAAKKSVSTERKYYRIKISEFWKWAKENPKYMRWYLYERNSLGEEPKWLDEAIKESLKGFTKNHNNWSDAEELYLKEYYKQGMPLIEISKKINRTAAACDFKLRKLGVKRHKVNLPWRDEETELLKELRLQGLTYKEIAEELGRTKSLIGEKCRLFNIEKVKKQA